VGVITKNEQGPDVFEFKRTRAECQILHRDKGNFTHFVNHSCKPNASFKEFTWLNRQYVLLVTNDFIQMDEEIVVDYGDGYWEGVDEQCLCGETCCRFKGWK